ncbi:MAG: hypothetical protein ACXABY_08265 [Candidatus Thorarchaeota archaeon]|jgi:hypothetical protein
MAEDATDGTESTEGQAPDGTDGSQTIEGAPGGSEGQPAEGQPEGTTQAAPEGTEQTFFDPNQVPDELQPAYKSMQGAFSKKMEALSANRQKVEAYDAFTADPVGQLQRLASQYGLTVSRAEAAQQLQQQGQQQQQNWEPQSWDEVLNRAEDQAYNRIKQDLGPVFQEMQSIKKQGIEQQLNDIDPTWRQYEEEMMGNLKTHPTLANDAGLLYKLSVPNEVMESRATQKALTKLEAKGKAAQVSGSSTTTKQPKTGLPDKPVSFDEAVKAAKAKMAEEGITRLGD